MEHNINKLKEIREAYAEDMGYKSFANMASSVNIVPRDISEIAKSYAEAVNSEIQAKCDRYEAALKWYADEGNYFGDNGELATAWKNKMPLKANEALSSGEWNKEVGFDYDSREFERGHPAPEGAIKSMHERWRKTGERVECECGRWIVPADGCPDCNNQKENKQ